MQRLLTSFAFLIHLSFTTGVQAEQTFADDLPTFACNIQPLSKDGLKTAKTNRERFAKACLACIGNECAMKVWPTGAEQYETICRNTYCLPKRVKRMAFGDGYNMSFKYTYRISTKGKAMLTGGEYLAGQPRGVTAEDTILEHRSVIEKLLSKLVYEPVVIGGEAKALINLEGVLETRANYEE